MNEEERLEGMLKSKNWKERQEGYIRLGDIWNSSGDGSIECIALLPMLQNESNLPALESAIDAILNLKSPPSVDKISKIFSNIGNIKTSIKTRVCTLVDFIAKVHTKEVVGEMVTLVRSKTPKTVCGAVSALVEITTRYDYDLEIVGECLKSILGHTDSAVRLEGTKLCVELFKKHGDDLRPYITEIKPIQLKELEEEFSKIRVVEKHEEKERKEVSTNLLKKCDDDKWNIRLEGLTELKKNIKSINLTSDIFTLLYSRINDPNNQVFFELLEIFSILKLKNQRVVCALVERLKDKKTVVTEKIKECLIQMDLPEEFIQKDFFSHKSPQVKLNIIDYILRRNIEKKEIIEWVRGCTKDQNVQVRNKAAETIKRSETKGDEHETHKDEVKLLFETPKKAMATPIKRAKVQPPQSTGLLSQEEREGVLESFYFKYPFFKEKNWSFRLENFKENYPQLLKEEIRDLVVFFYSHKESIFQLNLAALDLLIQRKGELDTVKNILMPFCVEKITEVKLQHKILEVFKLLDAKECLSFLVSEVKDSKQGKRMVCLVWLIGELVSKENHEIEEIFKKQVTGISEKKAIETLRRKYEEVMKGEAEKEVVKAEEGIIKGNVGKACPPIDVSPSYPVPPSLNFNLSPEIKLASPKVSPQYFSECIKQTQVLMKDLQRPKMSLKITERGSKGTGKIEDFFTSNFIRVMKEEDFTVVVDLFDTIDKILVSDFIINYYVEKRLASSYFNSLILFFISEKYILHESECQVLIRHLLENNMKEELKMMDRIYPVTKLFFILQKIGTDDSLNEILRLIDSYKMFRGDKKKFIEELKRTNKKALEKAVRECPDFLSFIDEIGSQYDEQNGGQYEKYHEVGRIEGNKDVVCGRIDGSKDVVCGRIDGSKDVVCGRIDGNKDVVCETKTPSIYRGPDTGRMSPFHTPTKHSAPLLAPSVLEDPLVQDEIECSLHSLSLNSHVAGGTPNLKKFRKEHQERNSLEEILDDLIDSNQEKSEKAFTRLSDLVDDNIDSLLFSANSIISSISIQLLDVLHRPLYATLILRVLLKLSKSQVFCEQLRVETLESVNEDLISMFDTLNKDRSDKAPHVQLVLDIITNLSLNSKPLMAIQVYLNLFSKGGNRDINLRLIWRHSKCLNRLSLEDIRGIVDVFENFYSKTIYSPLMDNRTTFKMLVLHIGQIVSKYPKEIDQLALKKYTRVLVGLFKTRSPIRVEDLRNVK